MTEELQYVYVTTTGWKSGNPHTIEIWFVAYDGRYYIVSEHRERSHWQNIRRNPAIAFRVGDRHFGRGRVVDPAAEPGAGGGGLRADGCQVRLERWPDRRAAPRIRDRGRRLGPGTGPIRRARKTTFDHAPGLSSRHRLHVLQLWR